MIYTRYIASHIHKTAALVLLILVSLSIFFTFVHQLDNLGRGNFGGVEFVQYLLLKIPLTIVEFIPLAALLGAMLSLGNLAASSELIAFTAAGLPLRKLIMAVLRASLVLALFAAALSEFVAPYTETQARHLKNSSIQAQVSAQSRDGIWIKDEGNMLYIRQLFPNGNAAGVEINQLDGEGRLLSSLFAASAGVDAKGWLLKDVRKTNILAERIEVESFDSLYYEGGLSSQLLESLAINPEQMSMRSLNAYIDYLGDNELSYQAESLSLWKKLFAPVSVMVLSVMAIPFVTGSQRHSNTGQRLMIGIMLGLGFVVANSVLIQLGEQLDLWPPLNASIPTVIFIFITIFLIRYKSA